MRRIALLIDAATDSLATILRAAGAKEVMTIRRLAHLVGGARTAATRAADRIAVRGKQCP